MSITVNDIKLGRKAAENPRKQKKDYNKELDKKLGKPKHKGGAKKKAKRQNRKVITYPKKQKKERSGRDLWHVSELTYNYYFGMLVKRLCTCGS